MTRARVLLLNQNYQPLNVTDVRRAIVLVGRGKAEALEHRDEVVRSAYQALPAPSIVRLLYMVKRPLHPRRLSRKEVFVRDGYRCQYCGQEGRNLTLDHVIPRSRGGDHSWTNVVAACDPCNHRKAGRTPAEAKMKLRRMPQPPKPNPYAFFQVEQIHDKWRPYLPWAESRFPGLADGDHSASAAAG